MEKLKIRVSVPDDILKIREVVKETWINTYPNAKAGIKREDIENKFKDDGALAKNRRIEEQKKRYEDERKRTWVAERGEKIIGFCFASQEKERGRIKAIYVLPKHQKRSVGSELLKKAIEWLNNNKKIYINVVEYNSKAIDFYKKHGFSKTGKRGVFDSAALLPSGKIMPEIELVKFI